MRKHLSIFTLLLSAAFAVGGAGVAFAERITAQYVSTRGTFSTEDTKSIDPYSADLGRERPAVESQVFTANPPAGHQVTTWLWKDDTSIRSEEDMSQVGSAQPTYTVTYSGKEGNRALGVRFDYIPFDVTFKGNGATSGSTASITGKNIDSSFSLTANGFKKTGYHFDHWANGLQKTFADQASVTGRNFWDTASAKFHAELSAVWVADTYTVTFDKNGGSTPSPATKSVTYDSTYGDLATCSRTGYTFAGWWTAASGGTKVTADSKVTITADQTLYAHWTANTYTVTFDGNGGSTPSSQSVTYGSTYGTLPSSTRTGYTFAGWWTAASGGTEIKADSKVTITANQTLYAHWTPVVYTITYSGLKQGVTHLNPLSYTIETPTITFSAPSEAAGYKFNGWDPASIPIGSTGNKTVTASYLTITYTPDVKSPLTYNGYSQTCLQQPLPAGVVAQGHQATDVGTHTATFTPMSGYCWSDGTVEPYVATWKIVNAKVENAVVTQKGTLTYSGEPQQPAVDASADVKGGQTVTWKYSTSQGGYVETMPSFTDAGTYSVYFEASAPYHDPAYGSFTVTVKRSPTAAVTVTPTSLRYTRKEQGPAVTVQHCSEAADSVKRATDVGTYKVKATPDVNYAWSNGETAAREFGWSIVDSLYTVQFDGNGGAGEMASTNLAYNEEYIVPECAFTKTGCEFQHWQVLIDKRAVTNYLAGTVVSNLTTVAGKVVTFKAEWLGRYTIAFDANGGEGEMASTNVERDVGFQLPSNAFTRIGYDFTTWTTNLSASIKPTDLVADGATVTNLVAAGETCTLHALWNAHRYTVIFDANGGTGSVPEGMEFIYDEAKELPSTPIPTEPLHYEFTGWGTNPKQATGTYQPGETVSNLTAVADGQVTLYAIWKFIPSTISAVLDCDNLYFENGEGTPWTVDEENYHFGGSSMTHLNERGEFTVRTESSGTLVFWWMGEYKYDPWDPRESRQTTLNLEYNDEKVSIDCTEDMTWQKKEIKILSASTVVFAHEGSVTCWVDHVTWTPDGSEPTPGEPVAVTAAGVTDGVFALTIPTESGVDYGVWTNADLTIDSWGLMGEPQEGKGNPLEFKWTILPEFPQLFFRAHKVEYK